MELGDAPFVDLADHLLRPGARPFVVAPPDGAACGVHLWRPGLDIGDDLGALADGGVIGRDQRLVFALAREVLQRELQLRPWRLQRGQALGGRPLGVGLGGQLGDAGVVGIKIARPVQPGPRFRFPVAAEIGLGQARQEAQIVGVVGAEPLQDWDGRGEGPLLAQPLHLGPEVRLVRGRGRLGEIGRAHRLRLG